MVTHAGWSYYLGWTVVIENNGSQVILRHMCCGESAKTSTPTGESNIQVSLGDISKRLMLVVSPLPLD